MYFFYIFIFISISVHTAYAEFNTTALDKYHDDLCYWLVDTSNSIDNYLIESNSTTSSDTFAELKTSFAIENTRASEYAIRLRLRLNLPKFQKKLRVVFEDEASDDALYDGTVLNSDYHLEDKNYFLRLEYFNYMVKQLNITSGGGIRFRKSSLHPYLNVKAKYKLFSSEREKLMMANRFRYYINGDIEDILSLNRLYTLNETLYYRFKNTLRYRDWESSKKIVNSVSLLKVLGTGVQASLGLALMSEWEDRSIEARYYQLYGTYRNLLYKDWIYYEFSPALLRREENNFNNSYRFMVNIGMIFKKD